MENFLPEIVFVFLGAVTRWSRQSGALHQPKARRRSIASRYQRAGDGSVVAAVGRTASRTPRSLHPIVARRRLPRVTLFMPRKMAYKHERQFIFLTTLS